MTPIPADGQAAKYVGRIGGLAVALGIGIAIAHNPGVAQADIGTGAADSSSQGSHKSSSDRFAGVRASRRQAQLKRSLASTDAAERVQRRIDDAKQARQQRVTELKAGTERRVRGATVDTSDRETPIRRPASPAESIDLASVLGAARRDIEAKAEPTHNPATPKSAELTKAAQHTATDPLASADQLAAEQRAAQIAKTPIVQLAGAVLKVAWYISAQKNFALVGGPDKENIAQLSRSVDEYINQAAMEVQLLDPNNPKILQQVMPPHLRGDELIGGTRIWYDNPDTVYRFVAVNAASEYEIHGQFDPDHLPADTNISVLTGLNGQTVANLSGEEIDFDPDTGKFVITVSSRAPGTDEKNHLQLPADATLITTRNTLSTADQQPMSLSITRLSGPPDSFFAQIGGFLIPGIGPAVTKNPQLVSLVSLLPPFKNPPLALQAAETALLIVLLGITKEDEYIRVATADPETGELRPPNVMSQPSYNAQFLSTQRQSTGYFQLQDDEALVLTVHPNSAQYFVVPITNDWTITGDPSSSLNNGPGNAIKNPDETYTIVISPTDPGAGVPNWLSTGGLNQGTISLRFQLLDAAGDMPVVDSQVLTHEELAALYPAAVTSV